MTTILQQIMLCPPPHYLFIYISLHNPNQTTTQIIQFERVLKIDQKMASTKPILLSLLFLGILITLCNAKGLSLSYYKDSCPKVESIVKKETAKIISAAPTLAAPLLRMHFHDCFVRVRATRILFSSRLEIFVVVIFMHTYLNLKGAKTVLSVTWSSLHLLSHLFIINYDKNLM